MDYSLYLSKNIPIGSVGSGVIEVACKVIQEWNGLRKEQKMFWYWDVLIRRMVNGN